jgi:UDP-N-acetylglucosamine 1-carboxyvinyltransferase
LLARFGKATFPQPGGDLIGRRPINRHLEALSLLGASVREAEGVYQAEATRLSGATIFFSHRTVMGTENALLAATLAEGETTIVNAAQEPEVEDLIALLRKMGAEIVREGDGNLKITGVARLSGAAHEILPDRNETVTYAVAAAATGGDLTLERTRPANLTAALAKMEKMGISFEATKDTLRVWREKGKPLQPVNIETSPHPGFMTDWQQPCCVLLTQAQGESTIYETIYANRFEYTKELNRMGASIKLLTPQEAGLPLRLDDDSYNLEKEGPPYLVAKVVGPTPLIGERMMIPDLRAGATLAIAALTASGKSEILGVEQVERGYEAFDEKLRAVGARIEKVEE